MEKHKAHVHRNLAGHRAVPGFSLRLSLERLEADLMLKFSGCQLRVRPVGGRLAIGSDGVDLGSVPAARLERLAQVVARRHRQMKE